MTYCAFVLHAPRMRLCLRLFLDLAGSLKACLLGCLLLLFFSGCASLPSAVARPVSQAWASPEQTRLGQLAQQSGVGQGPESGFYLLEHAQQALAARLALIAAAQKTLDLQYYAIHADETTEALLQALQAAAARGVRVRILLDDFNTTGKDAQVLKLAWVAGMELRLFNPLPGPRQSAFFRVLGSVTDIGQIQRRMHNKLFVADNALAITGGRNLGAIYFGQASDNNFVDMDVLSVGPVVRELSASFDQFWNNPLAYPAASLVTPQELTLPPPSSPLPPTPARPPQAALNLAELRLQKAPATLLADRASKLAASAEDVEEAQDTLVDGLLALLDRARRDVLIVSPYFVPGPRMMTQLAAIRRKGVRIRVLTNSLASNDAPAAHVGYARYRPELLAMGVELYELRALQTARLRIAGSSADSHASLHAKVIVLDSRLLVVGSMNLDLRSQLQNTEVALLIRSSVLARDATQRIESTLRDGAYRLSLQGGGLRWHAPGPVSDADADRDPDASLGLRLLVQLLAPFAPEEML